MVFPTFTIKNPLFCLKPDKGEYCRVDQLPALLKLWPGDLDDYSYPGTLRISVLLRNALRAERGRARNGHWAYDLNRHVALMKALREEQARLRILERGLPWHGQKVVNKPRLTRHPAETLRLPCPQKSNRSRDIGTAGIRRDEGGEAEALLPSAILRSGWTGRCDERSRHDLTPGMS
jgi:hypothetical protein